MTTLVTAVLCILTLIFAAGIIAIAFAHRRGQADYDGEKFEKPPRKDFWRNGK